MADPARTTSPRARDRSLHIAVPTTPAMSYTHDRAPGWDSPWAARPLESFSHRNIYEQLRNGETREEHPPDADATDRSWWPRTRKRARVYLLNNTYVPLVKHAHFERNLWIPIDDPVAVPVHQYHIYDSSSCYCNSNTKNGEA
jgi:hypothetical protein